MFQITSNRNISSARGTTSTYLSAPSGSGSSNLSNTVSSSSNSANNHSSSQESVNTLGLENIVDSGSDAICEPSIENCRANAIEDANVSGGVATLQSGNNSAQEMNTIGRTGLDHDEEEMVPISEHLQVSF